MKLLTELPENVKLSQHLRNEAEGYIDVMFFGITYYIPVTASFKKAFKAKRVKNKLIFNTFKQDNAIKFFLRDLISSIYLQIRDTIGEEIHRKLSDEINEGLCELFTKRLENRINKEFNQKQLEYKDEN